MIRRSAAEQEDLKPYCKSEKRSGGDKQANFPKDFTSKRKKTNTSVVFAVELFQRFLKIWITDQTF